MERAERIRDRRNAGAGYRNLRAAEVSATNAVDRYAGDDLQALGRGLLRAAFMGRDAQRKRSEQYCFTSRCRRASSRTSRLGHRSFHFVHITTDLQGIPVKVMAKNSGGTNPVP